MMVQSYNKSRLQVLHYTIKRYEYQDKIINYNIILFYNTGTYIITDN